MKSATTWTLEGLSSSDLTVLEKGEVWRIVEAQNVVATTSLVSNWNEQAILEDILEESKPTIPPEAAHLHYLRMTPFRYKAASGSTSLDLGSRFRASGSTEGVFYGAFNAETAAYETAFYKALFLSESPGMILPKTAFNYTAFQSHVSTTKALDLTSHPDLSQFSQIWESPDNYLGCQRLALEAREKGVEAIIFKSVRDPDGRTNIAVLSPSVFSDPQPNLQQTWTIVCNHHGMQIACEMPHTRLSLTFKDLVQMGDKRFRGIKFKP